MKRINLTLDDESAKVLEGKANKSQFMREALSIHNSGVLPLNLRGMQQAFVELRAEMIDLRQHFDDQYELVERLIKLLEDKLA